MRAWQATRRESGLGDLELRDVPEPLPPVGDEVLVEVAAAGLALPDLLLLSGGYPGVMPELPHPIGIEYSGIVRSCGPSVERLSSGDRVCGMVYPPQGAASEQLIVGEDDLATLPDSLSLIEGAAVPSAYMTAHDALHRHGGLRAGERVLVLAAASGVGLAAVELASAGRAEVYGAASGSKLERVREAGAIEVHDYRVDGWASGLADFDLVVDSIGGDSFARSYQLLGPGGRLICLDAASRYPTSPEATDYDRRPSDPTFDPIDLFSDGKSVVGINMPALWDRDGGQRLLLAEALTHFDSGRIRPAVSEVFRFEDAVQALERVKDRRSVGRVVLRVR